MKLSKLALVAAIACGIHSGVAYGQQAYGPAGYQGGAPAYGAPPAHGAPSAYGAVPLEDAGLAAGPYHAEAGCEACGEPVCGCEVPRHTPACGCTGPVCGCETGLGAGAGLGAGLGDCCLGDPFTLFDQRCGWNAGGWVQLGYHSHRANNNFRFNDYDGVFQLQQAWLWAEKVADGSRGLDFGGRIDYVYGTDGPDTQAFGQGSGWDTDWDHGGFYGHALPQAYGEVAYGDLSVKIGHFYTLIGWEVVPATGNFFYSHAYTTYNSEPRTHTGTLASYHLTNDVTLFGGHVFGWDSGFSDTGDAFLGGISANLTADVTLTYATVGGRFYEDPLAAGGVGNERGYMHSLVLNTQLTDPLQYVFQLDYLDTEDETGTTARETIGINQYLIYAINDCWAVGSRFEWWKAQGREFRPNAPGAEFDVYDLTVGLNYKPHANVLLRPEVRWDWDRDRLGINEENDASQTTFGIDAIMVF